MMTLATLGIALSLGTTPALQESDAKLPPIATSRFAPPDSAIRDLRMLGEPAPLPKAGEPLVGPPLEAWPKDGYTMLVFWSPFVGSSDEHLARLAQVDRDHDHIEGISIALGPRDRAQGMLQNLPGREKAGREKVTPPRTIIDEGNTWRETFLEPLGLTSLPAVVAIDREGLVSFHSPLQAMLRPLADIVSDTWDPQNYRGQALEYSARMNLYRLIEQGRSKARRGEITWDQVLKLTDEGLTLDPKNTPLLVKKFDILLADANRPEEAYEFGREVIAAYPRSPITLNDLAWHTVSFPNVQVRDLDFALEASRRANALQGWMDYGQLDTLARIHWMRGDEAEANRLQRKAVALAPDTWHGDGIRANLEAYTDGRLAPGELPKPYRSPRQPR